MIRRRDAGVSMIELVIALAVMVLALIALMSSVISSAKVADSSKESIIAYEAARAKIEEMRTYTFCGTFTNIFNYYKPGLAANTATVTGLNPVTKNGVAQPVLQICFPVGSNSSPFHLQEFVPPGPAFDSNGYALANYNSLRMGMPKDLNRNGTITDGGGSLDNTYNVLPVLVRVMWESVGKRPAQIEVVTYITDK